MDDPITLLFVAALAALLLLSAMILMAGGNLQCTVC